MSPREGALAEVVGVPTKVFFVDCRGEFMSYRIKNMSAQVSAHPESVGDYTPKLFYTDGRAELCNI